MKIIEEPIEYYIQRLQTGPRFALAGYSDAEWFCMVGERLGGKTALGQIINSRHGRRLQDVLSRRQNDPNFIIAVPKCLHTIPALDTVAVWMKENNLDFVAHERDMITDDLAASAGLFGLITQLRGMKVTMVGNHKLKVACKWLYDDYVTIPTPNLHMNTAALKKAVDDAASTKPDVFVVCAGVSAAVIIDRLYDQTPAFLMDLGSVFDAFAGIGGQREWRAKLFANPTAHKKWINQNLYGV